MKLKTFSHCRKINSLNFQALALSTTNLTLQSNIDQQFVFFMQTKHQLHVDLKNLQVWKLQRMRRISLDFSSNPVRKPCVSSLRDSCT